MNRQMDDLWRLQEIDTSLGVMEKQQRSFDGEIQRLQEEADQVAEVLANFTSQQEAKEVERLHIQQEIERLRGMIAQAREKLSQITNNKEYFAALKEIENAEKEIGSQENILLEIMEQLETLRGQVEESSASLEEKKEHIAVRTGEIREQSAALENDIAARQAERQTLVAAMDARLLARYDRIRRRFANAVVKVDNGTCRGCNVNVPPQVYINLLKGEEILNCPNCQRIMYSDREQE